MGALLHTHPLMEGDAGLRQMLRRTRAAIASPRSSSSRMKRRSQPSIALLQSVGGTSLGGPVTLAGPNTPILISVGLTHVHAVAAEGGGREAAEPVIQPGKVHGPATLPCHAMPSEHQNYHDQISALSCLWGPPPPSICCRAVPASHSPAARAGQRKEQKPDHNHRQAISQRNMEQSVKSRHRHNGQWLRALTICAVIGKQVQPGQGGDGRAGDTRTRTQH